MRKIILNLAISIDGYICDETGEFDWIAGHGDSSLDTKKAFDFDEFKESIDYVIMGSIAYEDCVLSGLDNYDDFKLIVATSRAFPEKKNVEFVNGDICKAVLSLKEEEGKDIWLFGGAGMTDAFIKADIVDEYIIGYIPVILGKGRKLFKDNNPNIKLKLVDYTLQDGIMISKFIKR